MAKIEFELKDWHGVDTEIGDEIEVTYPEIEIFNSHQEDDIEFYRPAILATAKVLCPPSKGLKLRITAIKEVDWDSDDLKTEFANNVFISGTITDFRRTVWYWINITKK